jgi:hypothetical protein
MPPGLDFMIGAFDPQKTGKNDQIFTGPGSFSAEDFFLVSLK